MNYVCQYSPAGNYMGEFADNVLEPAGAASDVEFSEPFCPFQPEDADFGKSATFVCSADARYIGVCAKGDFTNGCKVATEFYYDGKDYLPASGTLGCVDTNFTVPAETTQKFGFKTGLASRCGATRLHAITTRFRVFRCCWKAGDVLFWAGLLCAPGLARSTVWLASGGHDWVC